ncbi:hypothetical protein [Ralstonia sp. Ralssp110]|uniref:hypothetical protein n=1 Tax=Ralstonia TaxID=48736 RepID=UPI0005EBE033|nr:hypothetical protein UB44_17000 [Burkholderiaceae bacterium 26]
MTTRWLACPTCDRLCDHTRSTADTALPYATTASTWICTRCGTAHLVADLHSDQAAREQLEAVYGQQRLFD